MKNDQNLLTLAEKYGIFKLEDVLNKIELMKNEEILKKHPYAITQGKNNRWYTYLPDNTRPHGRRQIAKSTKEKINIAIIEDYKKSHKTVNLKKISIENIYEMWMIWRRNTGTDPKTIKENANDWKRFLSKSDFAKKKIVDIDVFDIETFFLEITKNHAITYKRLTNVKSVLNGLFKHGIRLKIIASNPMINVDFKQFITRCKPTDTKENYTNEERKRILDFLRYNTDIYSLAVQLDFYLCIRIGELISIRKKDIQGNSIRIKVSTRKHQYMNDDLTFSGVEYTIEERIKGNQREGFRYIPLTLQAQRIVNTILKLYPDGEYLFMRNGKPIYADSFNRYLKEKVCIPLNIPYRSSHQIRFTMATQLFEGGVSLPQLSTMLGHSDTRTTLHYIRQQKVNESTYGLMQNLLDT